MKKAVGVIAGNGKLPFLLASGIRATGRPVVAIGHREMTEKDLEGEVDSLHWVNIGELGRIIDILKMEGPIQYKAR